VVFSQFLCNENFFFARRVEDEFRKDQTPAAENEPMLGREKDCARFENFRKNVLKKE
jgi:hypothetical protein